LTRSREERYCNTYHGFVRLGEQYGNKGSSQQAAENGQFVCSYKCHRNVYLLPFMNCDMEAASSHIQL
jgi:hypothetical protein